MLPAYAPRLVLFLIYVFGVCLSNRTINVDLHEELMVCGLGLRLRPRLGGQWSVVEQESREDESPPSSVGAPAKSLPTPTTSFLVNAPADS